MYKFDLSLLKSPTARAKSGKERPDDLAKKSLPPSPARTQYTASTIKTDELTRSTRSSRSANTCTTSSTAEVHLPPPPSQKLCRSGPIHPMASSSSSAPRFHLPRKTKTPAKALPTIGIRRHELKKSRSSSSLSTSSASTYSVGGVLRKFRETLIKSTPKANPPTTLLHTTPKPNPTLPKQDSFRVQVEGDGVEITPQRSSDCSDEMDTPEWVKRASEFGQSSLDDDRELQSLQRLMDNIRAGVDRKISDVDDYEYSSDEDEEAFQEPFAPMEMSPPASEVSPGGVFGDLLMFVSNERKILEYSPEELIEFE